MVVIGVLTLVVAGRGSMQLGGFNSAAVGLGTACFGPALGGLADRFGQRPTLLVTAVINSAALATLAWVVYSPLPDWVMLCVAFVVGASATQAGPMSRSRLVTIIMDRLPASRRDRALNSTMAYESAIDEVIFLFGPIVVGALAVAFGPTAPVYGAAIVTVIFVVWFAFHPTASFAKTHEERAATLAPFASLFAPKLMFVVIGIFSVGLFFGSMLTSLTAYLQLSGEEERAGLMYGVMGVGSAILAFSVALFPPAFTRAWRWLLFAIAMFAGTIYLQWARTDATILLALLIIGIGIGPVLVTQFSLGAERSPTGRGTTVMAMLGSGIIVGQSLSAAITGWVSENIGTDEAFTIPLIATSLVVLFGIVNLLVSSTSSSVSADASREHTT